METKEHTLHLGNRHVEGNGVELPKDDPRYEELAYSGRLYPCGDSSFLHKEQGLYKYSYGMLTIDGVVFGLSGHTNRELKFSDVYHSEEIPGKTAEERKNWLIRNGFIK